MRHLGLLPGFRPRHLLSYTSARGITIWPQRVEAFFEADILRAGPLGVSIVIGL